jgi:putative nucleotidyltransferase with HDIG domain
MKLTTDEISARLMKLPPMTTAMTELIQSLDGDEVDFRRLGSAIGSDPVLAAKVLRVANSSFYGLPRRVSSIQDATIVLGLRTVRTLVLAAALTGQFPASTLSEFNLQACWRHGIGTAICARMFAPHAGLSSDAAFAAGLLHDIGRVGLAVSCPEYYRQVMLFRQERDCTYDEAEQAIFSLDHAAVGRAISERWNLPEAIRDAVAEHHIPQAGGPLVLSGLVHIADVLAHALDLAGDKDDAVPALSAEAWAGLHMSWPELQACLPKVEREAQAVALLAA